MTASFLREPSTVRVSDEIEGSVDAFAGENGISAAETRELIARWGNDHSILTAEAETLAGTRKEGAGAGFGEAAA